MKVIEFGNGEKKIAIVGSLHGNELIGKLAIERLNRDRKINAKIKAIIANEEAIKINRRFVDTDGNRCFPGKKDGNTEERMAFGVVQELKGCRYVIDIHSTYADMDDTAIITQRRSLKIARMTPLSKVVLMGHAIAKGQSINDYPEMCVSLEFSRKRSVGHVLKIVKNTVNNILDAKNSGIKKDFYLVKRFVNGSGTAVGLKNYRLVKKGAVIAVNGRRKQVSRDDFYPIFFGEKGYKKVYCMKAVKFRP